MTRTCHLLVQQTQLQGAAETSFEMLRDPLMRPGSQPTKFLRGELSGLAGNGGDDCT